MQQATTTRAGDPERGLLLAWRQLDQANWFRTRRVQHVASLGPFCFSLSLALIAIPAALPNHIPGLGSTSQSHGSAPGHPSNPSHPNSDGTSFFLRAPEEVPFLFAPPRIDCRLVTRPRRLQQHHFVFPLSLFSIRSFASASSSSTYPVPSFRVSKSPPPWSIAPHARNPTVEVT